MTTMNRITQNTITNEKRITDFSQYANMMNRVTRADSYKYAHAFQYPTMDSMFDYLSSRGGVYPKTIFVLDIKKMAVAKSLKGFFTGSFLEINALECKNSLY